MGDRYTITASELQLKERFNINVPEHYRPRFNAAPTQLLPVITQGSNGLSFFYWGQIPGWSKNKSLSIKFLFVDKDELMIKASAKNALQNRRCIIPIDGYYDWKRISKKGKVAHRVIFGNNEIVGLGGIWEEFEDESGDIAHTFKIITTASNEVVASLNDRMPMVISSANEQIWLNQAKGIEEISPVFEHKSESNLSLYSVSPGIEDLSNDSEYLIKPFAPADQFGNYSLFD